MSLPFETTDFDVIYTTIAEVLKVEYPQKNNETILEWYKRLLYELMSYVQTQFEPKLETDVINSNNGNNKKKQNAQNKISEPLFEDNIHNALEIISQDSNFAVYLFAWFLPILITTNDYLEVNINIENDEGSFIDLHNLCLRFDMGIFKFTLKTLNNKPLHSITPDQFNGYKRSPFLHTLFKTLNRICRNTTDYSYDDVKKGFELVYDYSIDPQLWSFKIGDLLYHLTNFMKPLFISSIDFKTNLETEHIHLTKSKAVPRKRFNARKYLNFNTLTSNETSAQIIRTLVVSIFRTFFDYDKDTISQELFDYLFKNKAINYTLP